MKKHYTNENTGISYTLHGDYYLPDLKLPEQPGFQSIGKYGYLHKRYLMECHRTAFDQLIVSGKLNAVLADLNEQAVEQIDCISRQMAETQGITEQLKIDDQLSWVARMNSIRNAAEEIVLYEVVYHV